MSDTVLVALVVNVCTLLTTVICRILSHYEHRTNLAEQRATSSDVADIKATMNGRDHP